MKRTEQSVAVVTRSVTTYELNDSDLVCYLRMVTSIPADAKDFRVEFRVPGGGDWPNQPIAVDADNPITVRFTVERDNPNAKNVG